MSTRRVDSSTGTSHGARRPEQADAGEARVVTGRYRTPWGMGALVVSEGRLVGVELPGAAAPANPAEPALQAGSPAAPPSSQEAGPADRSALTHWVGELEAYFRGERLSWRSEEITLDSLGLGPFEQVVYTTLLSIPPAVTVSYGMLAEMAGYPRAARAVGNAMAANPIPVVVPCHRVIRADGTLGNYGNDPAWKERLLTHERTHAPASERGRVR
ncbi:MAG: methylated-DNA--[protein]-cysteine S-methyltransferase [bacterium]